MLVGTTDGERFMKDARLGGRDDGGLEDGRGTVATGVGNGWARADVMDTWGGSDVVPAISSGGGVGSVPVAAAREGGVEMSGKAPVVDGDKLAVDNRLLMLETGFSVLILSTASTLLFLRTVEDPDGTRDWGAGSFINAVRSPCISTMAWRESVSSSPDQPYFSLRISRASARSRMAAAMSS